MLPVVRILLRSPVNLQRPKKGRLPHASSLCSPDIGVAGFSLTNAATGAHLQPVNDGDTLDLDQLQGIYGTREFSIVCNTTGPVESARLTQTITDPAGNTGLTQENTDNEPPWTLPGNANIDLGTYALTCRPFCENDLQGSSGAELAIELTVTELDCSVCRTECIFITGML